jgi:hypothetical protein
MTLSIKRLVVFGCSYSTGEEILYHELGSAFDNLRHDPRLFFNELEKNQTAIDKLTDIKHRQLLLAWPQKLADKLNIECVNFAESGNSMQKMLWQFLDQKSKGNIYESDLVLFAQTKPERSVFFKDTPASFQIASILDSKKDSIIGISKTGGADVVVDQATDKLLLNWFNDDRILWDFISVLTILKQLKSQHNLYVVPAMSVTNEWDLKEYNTELFTSLLHDLTTSDLYLVKENMDSFRTGPEDNLPWGHPSEEVHNRFAEYLYDRI